MKIKKQLIIGTGFFVPVILGVLVVNIFSGRGVCFSCSNSDFDKYVPNSEIDKVLSMQKNQSLVSQNNSVRSYEIHPDDVVKKIQNQENVILLDVRTVQENEAVRLENSLLLPIEELSISSLEKIGLGEDKKNQKIIIYCRSGNRSKVAHDLMKSFGFENVKSVAGGMFYWEANRLPFILK